MVKEQQQDQQQQDQQKIACSMIHRGGNASCPNYSLPLKSSFCSMCGMEAAYNMKLQRRKAFVLVVAKHGGEEEERCYRNNNNNTAIQNTTTKRISYKYKFLRRISSNQRTQSE
jgi:hypothetical protein